MYQGHKIAPSLLIPYGHAVWLARLCKSQGPALITAMAVWEARPDSRRSGPFGRALQTLHSCGWCPHDGWWEWEVPSCTDRLQLTKGFKLVKHTIWEQLRSQQVAQLVARRP